MLQSSKFRVLSDKKLVILGSDYLSCLKQDRRFKFKIVKNGTGTYALLKHNLRNVILLAQRGIHVASPLLTTPIPDWPGLYTPKTYQRITADFALRNRYGVIANGLGTGKTLAVLWAIDYLIRANIIQKVVIFCPISTLQNVWGKTLAFHFPQYKYVICHGTKKKRRQAFDQDVTFYITNHHGAYTNLQALQQVKPQVVVFDEASKMRGRGEIYKAFYSLVKEKETRPWFCWLVAGTPMPNSPEDALALIRLLYVLRGQEKEMPDVVRRADWWRMHTMTQIGPYKWLPKRNAEELVYAEMQPSICFTSNTTLEIPKTQWISQEAPLTKTQTYYFDKMREDLRVEYQEGSITAANGAVKFGKLLQITSGILYDRENGKVIWMEPTEKINYIKDMLDMTSEKIMVFVPFVDAVSILHKEHFSKVSMPFFSQGMTPTQRNKTLKQFENDPKTQMLIAVPDALAHGNNFQFASIIIWFAPHTKNEIYEQANGRIIREGQTKETTIVHLGCPHEQRLYNALQMKGNMQQALLTLIGE